MRVRTIVLMAVTALAAAGCDRKAEPAKAPPPAAPAAAPAPPAPAPLVVAEGFRHQEGFEASGYYMTPNAHRVGKYAFSHLAVGMPSDFQAWETGDRASTFGPILFQFDDVTSPRVPNELGGEGHSVTVRVLPEAYSFDDGAMRFRGRDSRLGEVVFVGTFDKAALARAKAAGSSQETVLSGDLKVGDQPPRKVAFTYWVGD